MSMLVRILDLSGTKPASIEAEINNACAELVKEGRFVVAIDMVDLPDNRLDKSPGLRCVMIRHMKDESVDHLKRMVEAENALQRLVDEIRPASEPDDADHDDMESAYSNGIDVANWETSQRIDEILAKLRA